MKRKDYLQNSIPRDSAILILRTHNHSLEFMDVIHCRDFSLSFYLHLTNVSVPWSQIYERSLFDQSVNPVQRDGAWKASWFGLMGKSCPCKQKTLFFKTCDHLLAATIVGQDVGQGGDKEEEHTCHSHNHLLVNIASMKNTICCHKSFANSSQSENFVNLLSRLRCNWQLNYLENICFLKAILKPWLFLRISVLFWHMIEWLEIAAYFTSVPLEITCKQQPKICAFDSEFNEEYTEEIIYGNFNGFVENLVKLVTNWNYWNLKAVNFYCIFCKLMAIVNSKKSPVASYYYYQLFLHSDIEIVGNYTSSQDYFLIMTAPMTENAKKRISMRLTREKPMQSPIIPPRLAIRVFRVIIWGYSEILKVALFKSVQFNWPDL